jgi:O-antigen/teichoic acid export membrane protein
MIVKTSLTDRTTIAARWGLAGAVIGGASQLLIGAVLARLLTPSDFGLMAFAFIVLGLVQPLGDLGLCNAIVQRSLLTERHIRAGFTAAVLLGVVIAIAVAAFAPAATLLIRDHESVQVLRVLSLGFALGGLSVVPRALLRRRMDFKRQFFIDTCSYVLGYGALAILLAIRGWGVWSLVWGGLFQGLVTSVGLLAFCRHSMRPLLATREIAELLQFGIGSSATSVVNYLALNVDNFVVGRNLGAASLGLYSRAYNLMNLPYTYSARVLSGVLFPAFSEVQGEAVRVRRAYLLLTEFTGMIAAPAMALLAVVAPHLVRAVYGPKWTASVLPLQILCLAGYFRALYHLGGVVAQSAGRVYSELWRQAVYAGAVVAGAVVGSRYGLAGVAAGVDIAILYMFLAKGQLALSIIGTGWFEYARVQTRALVTGAITGLIAVLVRFSLESYQASSGAITLAVLGSAAIPWISGLLWVLSAPRFDAIRLQLPGRYAGLVVELRRRFA